ncbi:MAG: peptide chain release factor N(5)-glutamine methyltransferase [Verrucomicrobiota bacterium]
MLSIREIKERTEKFFRDKGVPNPSLDTDLLLAHTLGIKRLEIYLDLERPLTDAELDVLRPLVKRRSLREPLQYILGSVEFSGLELKVDKRALIPRQETEELIELIAQSVEAAPKTILDLGTGTGALALSLAVEYPEASVTALDYSAEALSLAKENASALGLEDRIEFLEGSWFEPLEEGQRFDLIVSNPPYLTEEEMATAEPEIVDYEPEQALASGVDGLNDLRILMGGTPSYLKAGGLLALETGIAQHEQLAELCVASGFIGRSHQDLSGRPRFYIAQSL